MASSSNEYIPAKPTDSRSPCPALNALANHGYLPRDGKNITTTQLVSALTNVYKISYPFAISLSLGSIALDGHGLSLDLEGLCAHNKIEHDASIAHRDLDETGGTVPTNKPDPALIQEIIDSSDGHKVTLENLIRAKVNREIRAKISDAYPGAGLMTFSHGELVLVTEVVQKDGPGIPVEWFKAWFLEERLPEGLNPPNTTGFMTVHSKASRVSQIIAGLHGEAAKERRDA